MTPTLPLVEFRAVAKRFASALAVDAVSLALLPGEFFVLLGPSGCGKTTLMRMLAGFETPDAGDVLLEGKSLAGLPPHRRPVNMMFQSYALFPHMRVGQNIAFGLAQEGLPRAEIARRVAAALELVKLEGLERRWPRELSGGQQQRVALARVLVKRPKVLLLDEPLAALDRKLREETQAELKQLQARLHFAFLMVTHDQDEAMALADRIGVMDKGRLVQIGTPREIYERPADSFVARFVGEANFLRGNTAMLRPEKLSLSLRDHGGAKASGTVCAIRYGGDASMVEVALADGAAMKCRIAGPPPPQGARVWLHWDGADEVSLAP